MSTTSEFPADVATRVSADERATHKVFVWDAPVRLFHWLMVICFAGAYVTAESEHWRLLHVTLGYTMAGLVGFRIIWGLVGTQHARFASFVRGPRAALAYLRSLLGPRPQHYLGHNPAGGLAIVGLLALIALTAASGYATYNELGGDWLEELHEFAADALLILVGVHLAGVAVGSFVHKENLVRAMITGRKPLPPETNT
ncbi:cytochrome b/b6 domain-containing protein [Piscinibacter sp.]|uniref:cytochrome b/b6 domain-containing protein n=1 Tax=Piscinibacter sp. TaxID=1903157 RepID=UPI003783B2A5